VHKLTSADVVSLHLHFVQHMHVVLTSAVGSSTSRYKTDGLFSCTEQQFVELTSYSNFVGLCFEAGGQKLWNRLPDGLLRQTISTMNSLSGC